MEIAGEILNINNEYASYIDYKAAVDAELRKSAESFVRIGYLLKIARDTDILKESGYESVNDFAWKEYKLERSQVSRFIRINDEFSEGGYSMVLQERYRGIGYAKLAIMLTLPAAVNEEITENYSKSEIQTIKEEVEAEKEITDLEVMMEPKNEDQEDRNIFGKVLHQLGYDYPELYIKLYDAVENTVYEGNNISVVKKIMDALAPTGEAIHTVRVSGEGRKMLSIKGENADPVIVDIRSNEKVSCSWDSLIIDMECLCDDTDAKKSWEKVYNEPFPVKEELKKAEVAPVQQSKPSKVTKAKVNNNAKNPKQPGNTTTERTSGTTSTAGENNETDSAVTKNDSEPATEIEDDHNNNILTVGQGECVSTDDEGDGESEEQGCAGNIDRKSIEELLKEGDKAAGAVYDYFIETEIEEVTEASLKELKIKVSTLDMIIGQILEVFRIARGEE